MTNESLPISDTVRYRSIPGWPAYAVGDDGSVWSRGKSGYRATFRREGPWRRMKPAHAAFGYEVVVLHCRGRKRLYQTVHEIVLKAFVGPRPKGYHARHIDGNHLDNRLQNLTWGTVKENMQDQVRHGTRVKGEKAGRAVLTKSTVTSIREGYRQGKSQSALGREFRIGQSHVSQIVTRKIWCHV